MRHLFTIILLTLLLSAAACEQRHVRSGPGSVTGRDQVWRASDAPSRQAYVSGETDYVRTDPNAREPGALQSIGQGIGDVFEGIGDLLLGWMAEDDENGDSGQVE